MEVLAVRFPHCRWRISYRRTASVAIRNAGPSHRCQHRRLAMTVERWSRRHEQLELLSSCHRLDTEWPCHDYSTPEVREKKCVNTKRSAHTQNLLTFHKQNTRCIWTQKCLTTWVFQHSTMYTHEECVNTQQCAYTRSVNIQECAHTRCWHSTKCTLEDKHVNTHKNMHFRRFYIPSHKIRHDKCAHFETKNTLWRGGMC